MFSWIKEKAKRNPTIVALYRNIFKNRVFARHSIPEIRAIRSFPEEPAIDRINLVVPSINEKHLFGGINTAISLFDSIGKKAGEKCCYRLIVTDAEPDAMAIEKFKKYEFKSQTVGLSGSSKPNRELYCMIDRELSGLPVSERDRFLVTAWWTAYAIQEVLSNLSKTKGKKTFSMAYIIQDFEPGFYNWSTHYALAESTYVSDVPTNAIFNSSLLKEFFKGKKYCFEKEYFFEPKLNSRLKPFLSNPSKKRQKQIIFYGRPSVDRNCFFIIVEALRLWIKEEDDAKMWRMISVGELHPPVDIGKGMALTSVGKLSLEDYADLLSESAIGVSLMLSPHPSYPPLEMAHFGLLTITNGFGNKDLSQLHQNIHSISSLSPHHLAQAIGEKAHQFLHNSDIGIKAKSYIPKYIDDSDPFPFVDELLKDWQIE
jgi:O-antigen biosynthesis protein